jgi:orotate phosphoribosyltransferase
MRLESSDVERIFKQAGALLEGHFVLASGRHSPRYLEKFRVLERPDLTARLCAGIAAVAPANVRAVAGPTTGGVVIAHEVARQLGARALFAEREEGTPTGRVLRRGQRVEPGERVLVVDDILTTGGSVRETIAAVRSAGGAVVGASVFVDRSDGVDLGVPLTALWTTRIETYESSGCPLCAGGVPAVKPGTTPAVAGGPNR